MGKNLKILFMSAFFISLVFVVMWTSTHRPRIMILQSYATDYIWTKEVDVGLDRILADKSWIDIRHYFMDTKNHTSKDYLRRVGISVRNVIENLEPDVLIAVDDDAQKLAAKYFVDHPRIKIVFVGVNGSVEPYGYDKAGNVTGIYERKPVKALSEMMQTIAASTGLRGAPRATFISDKSHSADRDHNYMQTESWDPVIYNGHKSFDTFPEWKEYVLNSANEAEFLLVGGYRKLYRDKSAMDKKSGPSNTVSPKEVATWTEENSPIPVLGMNIFNTDDGVMISVGVSPYEQGEVAANMALDIISGRKSIDQIPIQTSKQYVVSMRKSALEARNIKLPQVFEAFARTTNNYIP